jgi:hypothetical protein
MNNNQHLYLFILEVEPTKAEHTYSDLPLHCTLMHHFWSDLSPAALGHKVGPLFEQTSPPLLVSGEQLAYGPRKVVVNRIDLTRELKTLHTRLYTLLNELGVEYTAPEWVGEGYESHVTHREDGSHLAAGEQHISKAAYLVEIIDQKRAIRMKFDFAG